MAEKNNNYILIGMPGSGKSTIGVLLAKALGYDFVDTDLVIQQKGGGLLKEIIARIGNDGFKQLEEDVNASIDVNKSVIAPGGSAVYSDKAMRHFKDQIYDAIQELKDGRNNINNAKILVNFKINE